MRSPGELFWRLLPAVRATERSQAVFFTALLTLVSAAQTMGLAGSEALLLARIGSARLPEIFIAASLLTLVGGVGYAARVGRSRNDRLLIQMLVGSALVLFAGAWATTHDLFPLFVLPALFCFFYLTQSVFVSHFWTFSGDYFDTLTAKRLFPVFVVGSSIGGLLGGAAAVGLTRAVGPAALVWSWGALLLAAAALLRLARRPLRRWGPLELEEADETSVEGMRGATRYLRASPLGRWLLLSALGMVVAIFFAQYLYSRIFAEAYPDPATLAAFFGAYLAVTNLVEIALELWLTPWLIRRFGVPTAQLVHPLLTLLSFGGLLLRFGLVAGVGARVTRELVENAVAQPIRTLVYNALPQRLRGRIRAFLEGVVVNAGMLLAGVLLLVLETPDPRWLSAAGGAAAGLYLLANLRVRTEYLRELVDGIRHGRLDFGAMGDEIGDLEAAQLVALCDQLLGREAERPSRSLLRLLPTLAKRGIVEPLLAGAGHPHRAVRETCVRELAGVGSDDARVDEALLRGLADPDAEVRLAAMHALVERGAPRVEQELAPLLSDPEPRVRAAAAAELGDRGLAVVREMLRSDDTARVAAALAVAPRALADDVLARFADPDPELRAKAMERAARVATHLALPRDTVLEATRAPEVPVRCAALALVPQAAPGRLDAVAAALSDPSALVRRAAIETLSAQGEAGAQAAEPFLRDGNEPAADGALRVVVAATPPARRREILRGELRHRVRAMWSCLLDYQQLPGGDDVASAFLRAAFADALLRHRSLAFRVLSLLENERIVQKVHGALRSGGQRTRADALEILSHLGDRESAGLLVLMHEAAPLRDRRGPAEALVGAPTDVAGILREAIHSESRWVRSGAAAVDPALGHNGLGTDVMERLLALKQVPLFANLTLDQLEAIHQLAHEVTFLPNEVVMREGEPGSELFLLLEGRLDVYLGWDTPEQSRLGEITAVDYVGEMAILDDAPRSATIVAVEHSRMLSLEGESLKDLILQMPEISFEIFRVLTTRVRTAERRLQER
ncbi:MAG: HEAT repeat domain-containing protein [Myxococcota bacterium]